MATGCAACLSPRRLRPARERRPGPGKGRSIWRCRPDRLRGPRGSTRPGFVRHESGPGPRGSPPRTGSPRRREWQDAPKADRGCGVVPDAGAQGRPRRGAQISGYSGNQYGGDPGAKDRQKPDAQGRGADQGLTQGDPPGHHGRVVIIAKMQVLGPETVIGLILGQGDDGGRRKTQGRHGKY